MEIEREWRREWRSDMGTMLKKKRRQEPRQKLNVVNRPTNPALWTHVYWFDRSLIKPSGRAYFVFSVRGCGHKYNTNCSLPTSPLLVASQLVASQILHTWPYLRLDYSMLQSNQRINLGNVLSLTRTIVGGGSGWYFRTFRTLFHSTKVKQIIL